MPTEPANRDASHIRSPSAERIRRWRQRGRDGSRLVVVRISKEAVGLLTSAGWVGFDQAGDRDLIAEAIAKLVGTALYRRVPPRGWAPAEAQIALLARAR